MRALGSRQTGDRGEETTVRRTIFGFVITCALGCLCVAPLAAEALPPKHVPRIGLLLTNSRAAHSTDIEAFHRGLHALGFVEGQNISLEYRYADGHLEQLPQFAAELVRLNVAAIVTSGSPPTRAAQHATKTIPIAMTTVGDPLEGGFIASLAHPGGNITGLTIMTSQLSGKRLELLKEAVPEIARVAVFVDPTLTAQQLQEAQLASQALGLTLRLLHVQSPDPDLDGAFSTATRQRADALLMPTGQVLNLHRKRVVDLAAQNRLPAMYFYRGFVEAGGLMSYGPSLPENWRRAATYVDKILKGAKPADLPVEQPTKFELVINLKTAEALGLTIPPALLFQADEVIR
jgi:putative tryptophan/tyrosine transport system substrate-binding protein